MSHSTSLGSGLYLLCFLTYSSIAEVVTRQLGVGVDIRSSAGPGVGISAKVESVSMTGRPSQGYTPQIITTKADQSGVCVCVCVHDLWPLLD